MSNLASPAAAASLNRDALLADAASAFRISGAVKVRRGAAIGALLADGMTEPQAAAALGKLIGSDAPSRATVGFYGRTQGLYVAVNVDSPALFDVLWTAVTRGKGVSGEMLAEVLIPGDSKGTIAAVKSLVKRVADEAAEAREAAKSEVNRAEAAAEDGAGVVASDGGARDYAAILAGMRADAQKRGPEHYRRFVVALLAEVETANSIVREARKSAAAA
jgi:hypothetical protein